MFFESDPSVKVSNSELAVKVNAPPTGVPVSVISAALPAIFKAKGAVKATLVQLSKDFTAFTVNDVAGSWISVTFTSAAGGTVNGWINAAWGAGRT